MVIEAYSTTKPSLPYRGLLSAALLLLVTTGLAGGLTYRRNTAWSLDRIQPSGWDLSFRLPKGFVATSQSREGNVLRFQHTEDGATSELSFWRLETNPGMTEVRIAERVLRDGEGFFSFNILGPPPERSIEKMGSRPAIELRESSIPMVVRAITLKNGRSYAVALRLPGRVDDAEPYHVFDRACRSIEFGAE